MTLGPKFRFAVTNREADTLAATWTCVVDTKPDRAEVNVYLFARTIGYALKFSVHTMTGNCHLKYTPRLMQEQEGVVQNQYVDKWDWNFSPGYANPLTIVTPASAVNRARSEQKTKKEIAAVDAPKDGQAAFIAMFVTARRAIMTGNFFYHQHLRNGGCLMLATSYGDIPKINLPDRAQFRFFKDKNEQSLREPGSYRMMGLAGEGATRQVFDCLVEYASSPQLPST